MSAPAAPPLVRVQDLVKHYAVRQRLLGRSAGPVIRAVDGVSLEVLSGETLGLVGESGCGKSTLGRCVLRLTEPTAGRVEMDGTDLQALDAASLRRRRRDMQIIFQDPYSSLNPRMRVGRAIEEPLVIHRMGDRRERLARVAELLELVGLDPSDGRRFPHEFSGGQRQRIGIARALASRPRFIVADEPVSSLDVSIQAQIVNLLQDLQERLGVAYLFISHGLPVVRHISRRVAIMYLGRIVEEGPAADLFAAPLHPYTRMLRAAVPAPDPREPPAAASGGEIPSAARPPAGCRFHPRCPDVMDICRGAQPALVGVAQGRRVACFLHHQEASPP